jgi:hypothetical protein
MNLTVSQANHFTRANHQGSHYKSFNAATIRAERPFENSSNVITIAIIVTGIIAIIVTVGGATAIVTAAGDKGPVNSQELEPQPAVATTAALFC